MSPRRRNLLLLLLLGANALLMAAAVARARPRHDAPRDDARAADLNRLARVILVTLDGPLRADVLEGRLLPTLHEAVRRQGVLFPAQATSPYALSLPGYQVLATGQKTVSVWRGGSPCRPSRWRSSRRGRGSGARRARETG